MRLHLPGPSSVLRLVASDAMSVSRDPMLAFAMAMSILPAVAFALTRSAMDAAALSAFGTVGISRYVVPVVLVLPATLIGWVTGFLLLEDRDDSVLLAVDVTPLGKMGFLTYRAAVTALLAALVTGVALPLVLPAIDVATALVVVLWVAAEAVLASAILPAIARNKVEGLALTKLTNITAVVPLVAFLPWPWRFVAAPIPTFWIGEVLNASSLPVAVVGTVIHALAIAGTFLLVSRKIG